MWQGDRVVIQVAKCEKYFYLLFLLMGCRFDDDASWPSRLSERHACTRQLALSASGASYDPCVVGPSLYRCLVGQRPAIRRGHSSLDPWIQTGFRLVVACCTLQAAGKEWGVRCPSSSNSHDYAVLYFRHYWVYSTAHYQILCTALCLVGTRKSGLMLYHLPWIARNFHIHRVISLSPVSRGYICLLAISSVFKSTRIEPWQPKSQSSTPGNLSSLSCIRLESPSHRSETTPGDQ